MSSLAGIITALITPFDRKGELMEDSLRELVDFQIRAGVNGLFLCGTGGSGAIMRPDQKTRVFEVAAEQADGRIAIIAHVGAPSTEEAMDLAGHAEKAGADAVGCVPPYYFTPDEPSIIDHFRRVAEAAGLPVYVYNIPRCANTNIRPDLMLKLCEIENIMGVKDSSRDFIQLLEYIRVLPEDRTVLCGTDAYILPALFMGAKGAITAYANAFPEAYVKFYNLFLRGEMEAAREEQFRLSALRRALQRPPLVPHYEALRLRGFEAGYPRPPLRAMDEEEAEALRTRLKRLDLL